MALRITAKADYAVRAALELAEADGPVRRDNIAAAQEIPANYLNNILIELRHARIVRSQAGHGGGYQLARPAAEISIADVIRAVDGPLAEVRGGSPDDVHYSGSAEALEHVWVAVRASLRSVVEQVTVADVVSGSLPAEIGRLALDGR